MHHEAIELPEVQKNQLINYEILVMVCSITVYKLQIFQKDRKINKKNLSVSSCGKTFIKIP